MFRKVLKRLKNIGQKSTCLDNSGSQLANSCSYLAVTQPDVFIETLYEGNNQEQTRQTVRRKRIGDQMAVDLEEVFNHYFSDVPAFVRSACKEDDGTPSGLQKAYKRLRELQHTKHFLTRMIQFYESQQSESVVEDGLEHFMDVYFSSLYDMVLACIRTIELEHPELGVIGKRPSFLHTSSTTYLSKRISLPVCVEEEDQQDQELLSVPCPYEPIISAAPRLKNGWQRRTRKNKLQNSQLFRHVCLDEQTGGHKAFGKCLPPLKYFDAKFRVVEKYKLVACAIEKNMSTVLTAIMCYLFNQTAFIQSNRSITSDSYNTRFCKGKNEHQFIPAILRVYNTTKLYDWTLVAIVRDPIERFLSGFVDKCINEKKASHTNTYRPTICYGCAGNLSCFLDKEYERAEQFSRNTYKSRQWTHEDIHFYPQNCTATLPSVYPSTTCCTTETTARK
uniref:Carbohydrate sulfotransferase n=1 Tax=Ditylenchus dipsaci TaxID=166011 RepID=A0A915E6N3_9BILA